MTSSDTIMSIGEILVEFVSHETGCGLARIARYSGPYPSGAPAIFVDQAARMGARTAMVGGVGDDGFGRSVLSRLAADGVDVTGVTRTKGKSTGVAFVTYYADGARDFIFHLTDTAADHVCVNRGAFERPDTILHVSAASLGNARLRACIMDAVRATAAAGGRISCDPNARPELMRDEAARTALDEVMGVAWCLLPSTSDLAFLCPDLSEDAAIAQLLSARAEIVALKRGSRGATVAGAGTQHDFEGHAVEEVDPTGAGDCFGGTFVSLLAQGEPLYEAGRQANAAGAIAVTRHGPMEGNSSPQEIAAFLATRETGETG